MHKTIKIGRYGKFYVFWFYVFFSFYLHTNNTNSLIIVGAHITEKKTKGIMYNLFL